MVVTALQQFLRKLTTFASTFPLRLVSLFLQRSKVLQIRGELYWKFPVEKVQNWLCCIHVWVVQNVKRLEEMEQMAFAPAIFQMARKAPTSIDSSMKQYVLEYK